MKSSYCFVFVLVSVASIWNISAHDIPRDQLGGNAVVTQVNVVSTVKGQDIHEVASPSTATKEDKRIRGRKMAVEYKVMKLEKDVKVVVVDAAVSGRNSNSKTAASSSSKLEGKSSRGSQEANVECKQSRTSSRFSSEKGVDDHEYSGFVAFSQDYHSPRHHPPKNN